MSTSLQQRGRTELLVPCGIGELIDKITILEIKADHLDNMEQLDHVRHELSLLRLLKIKSGLTGTAVERLESELKNTNMKLWDIEDALRIHEAKGDFGAAFIVLARQVYQTNDKRAALKKAINILFKSAIIEEKLYTATAPKQKSSTL